MNLQALPFGIITNSLTANAGGTGTIGLAFALSGNPASLLTIQTGFGSAPSTVQIDIQVSLDAINWVSVKSLTTVTGDLETIRVAAKFVRANIIEQTGGGAATVTFYAKRSYGEADSSGGGGGQTYTTGAGSVDADTIRTVAASNSPEVTVLGTTSGAAVVTDAPGTIQQYLRGIVKLIVGFFTTPGTLLNGQKLVTTAGTRVTLASSRAIKSVVITALSTNTGIIYVGDTTVASSNGLQLKAGGSVAIEIDNLNKVNLDSSVNGEGVTYAAVDT